MDTVGLVMKLSIIVISYNTRQMTIACLKSIDEQSRGLDYEVIVLDNASTDGSAEAISALYPQTRLIRSPKNLGFAQGNNVAVMQSTGEWILLLNPDTIILDGAILKVIAFAQRHPEASIVGGRTFFADLSLNYNSCHDRPTPWSLFCMGFGLSSLFRRSRLFSPESLGSWQRDSVREVDVVTGCFLLLKKSLWNMLNGFDPAFFMYGEETDLCLRARQQGHRCFICPDARLIHYGGASEKTREDKMIKIFRAKHLLFQRHWHPRWITFGLRMLDIWALSRMIVFRILSNVSPHFKDSYSAWHGIWKRRSEYR